GIRQIRHRACASARWQLADGSLLRLRGLYAAGVYSAVRLTVGRMKTHQCAECGAMYIDEFDSCAARFETLLAVDHSRREPWGSRHGQAFAAFALQHPNTCSSSLDRASGGVISYLCRERRGEACIRCLACARRRDALRMACTFAPTTDGSA